MSTKLTMKQFTERARQAHGNLYNYSKVEYVNYHHKVCIIDPEYGEFWQPPADHLAGRGSPKRRAVKLQSTFKSFLKRAKKIHGNLYNYSKVEYQGSYVKVCIIDPDYGEFWQRPNSHMNGQGSWTRAQRKKDDNLRKTLNQFIEEAVEIHNGFYNYSKVNYINITTKVCIIDPKYGEFWQAPDNHLRGHGCFERSHNGTGNVHLDHIIPLVILGTRKDIDRQRPLYKFLNSDINIQPITGAENNAKSDWIEYNGVQIRGRDYKNNYKIISDLSEKLLNTNIDTIINEDKIFMKEKV